MKDLALAIFVLIWLVGIYQVLVCKHLDSKLDEIIKKLKDMDK